TLNDTNALAISGTVTGSLNAAAAGALTDAGPLTAGGNATLSGSSVTFDDADDFQGVVNVASGGTVLLTDTTNLILGPITATNTVTLVAGGAIIDGNGAAVNVTAPTLSATAVAGIGSDDTLETAVGTLMASNTASGNIAVNNSGALVIGGFGVSCSGAT